VFWTGLATSDATVRRALLKVGAAVLVAGALAAGGTAWARSTGPESGALAPVPLASLPVQAQSTHQLILAGGPFPYPKDGTVFGNRERILPAQARGYYREYTVKTPGSRDRGARRIVCGGKPPTQPDACFYTDDHYASFKRIVPTKAAP
jgi:ribonuclease T1